MSDDLLTLHEASLRLDPPISIATLYRLVDGAQLEAPGMRNHNGRAGPRVPVGRPGPTPRRVGRSTYHDAPTDGDTFTMIQP